MNKRSLDTYITADPRVCHGKPTFKGTRVMVWQVLEMLEKTSDPDQIYAAYPSLPKEAVSAALHYAAEKAKSVQYVPFPIQHRAQVTA